MQINGVSDFVSRIASLNGSANIQRDSFLPLQASQAGNDSLVLSDIGRKLSLNVNKAPALAGNQTQIEKLKEKWEAAIRDPMLQLADNSMAKAENILERIHDLTIAAQDEKLTDFERVNMQIEIEDLRANFAALPQSMLSQAEGGPEIDRIPNDINQLAAGNGSSVLSRMRDRIMEGKKWDVREAWSPLGFSRVANDGDTELIEVGTAGDWYEVENQNVLTQRVSVGPDGKVAYETVTTNKKIPTVRDVLESETPIVVMDAESAAEGTQIIEQQIAAVRQWRGKIAQANASMQSNQGRMVNPTDILYEAANALKRLAFPDGVEKMPLTDPDVPDYYLYTDGVYDIPHLLRNITEGGGSGFLYDDTDSKSGRAQSAYYDTALSDRDAAVIQADESNTVTMVDIKGY